MPICVIYIPPNLFAQIIACSNRSILVIKSQQIGPSLFRSIEPKLFWHKDLRSNVDDGINCACNLLNVRCINTVF
jgi:hypothetical protein